MTTYEITYYRGVGCGLWELADVETVDMSSMTRAIGHARAGKKSLAAQCRYGSGHDVIRYYIKSIGSNK